MTPPQARGPRWIFSRQAETILHSVDCKICTDFAMHLVGASMTSGRDMDSARIDQEEYWERIHGDKIERIRHRFSADMTHEKEKARRRYDAKKTEISELSEKIKSLRSTIDDLTANNGKLTASQRRIREAAEDADYGSDDSSDTDMKPRQRPRIDNDPAFPPLPPPQAPMAPAGPSLRYSAGWGTSAPQPMGYATGVPPKNEAPPARGAPRTSTGGQFVPPGPSDTWGPPLLPLSQRTATEPSPRPGSIHYVPGRPVLYLNAEETAKAERNHALGLPMPLGKRDFSGQHGVDPNGFPLTEREVDAWMKMIHDCPGEPKPKLRAKAQKLRGWVTTLQDRRRVRQNIPLSDVEKYVVEKWRPPSWLPSSTGTPARVDGQRMPDFTAPLNDWLGYLTRYPHANLRGITPPGDARFNASRDTQNLQGFLAVTRLNSPKSNSRAKSTWVRNVAFMAAVPGSYQGHLANFGGTISPTRTNNPFAPVSGIGTPQEVAAHLAASGVTVAELDSWRPYGMHWVMATLADATLHGRADPDLISVSGHYDAWAMANPTLTHLHNVVHLTTIAAAATAPMNAIPPIASTSAIQVIAPATATAPVLPTPSSSHEDDEGLYNDGPTPPATASANVTIGPSLPSVGEEAMDTTPNLTGVVDSSNMVVDSESTPAAPAPSPGPSLTQ